MSRSPKSSRPGLERRFIEAGTYNLTGRLAPLPGSCVHVAGQDVFDVLVSVAARITCRELRVLSEAFDRYPNGEYRWSDRKPLDR